VPHQGLPDERFSERLAPRAKVQRLDGRLPQQGRAAQHAIEPSMRRHLQDGRHAAAGIPYHHAPGAAELDLGACVAAVAQLVLQPHDADGVAPAIGAIPGHEKARQAFACLGQHQMGV